MLKSTFFGRKEIPKEIKTQVYQKVVRPSLIYESESWALSERNKSKVKAMEMRFFGRIKGITRRGKTSGRTKYSADWKGDRAEIAELAWTYTQNERAKIS